MICECVEAGGTESLPQGPDRRAARATVPEFPTTVPVGSPSVVASHGDLLSLPCWLGLQCVGRERWGAGPLVFLFIIQSHTWGCLHVGPTQLHFQHVSLQPANRPGPLWLSLGALLGLLPVLIVCPSN